MSFLEEQLMVLKSLTSIHLGNFYLKFNFICLVLERPLLILLIIFNLNQIRIVHYRNL